MDPSFWHQRWQENRIGFHQTQINFHLERFWPQLNVPPGELVFVPLCGKSLDMLWLASQGHRVFGVELSPIAVSAFFRENGLTPKIEKSGGFERYVYGEIEILCGDFFDLESLHLRDARGVYDRASLIALPSETRIEYARHLRRILPSRPPILLITLDYPKEARQGPPFAVNEEEVRRLYANAWEVKSIASENIESTLREHVFYLSPPP